MAWTAPATYSTSEVVTATKLNTHIRDNMNELWHQVAYVEFTANVSPNSTEASPNDVVSSGAITYVAKPIIVEFYALRWDNASAGNCGINLWDGSTDLGRIAANVGSTGTVNAPVQASRQLTPTAASHTYRIRAWGAAGTTIFAGAGGVGTYMPGFIRVWQKGGT